MFMVQLISIKRFLLIERHWRQLKIRKGREIDGTFGKKIDEEEPGDERKRSKSISLTLVIIYIVVTVHLQRNGAVWPGPAFNTVAVVLAFLQRTLAMTGASVLATSYGEVHELEIDE